MIYMKQLYNRHSEDKVRRISRIIILLSNPLQYFAVLKLHTHKLRISTLQFIKLRRCVQFVRACVLHIYNFAPLSMTNNVILRPQPKNRMDYNTSFQALEILRFTQYDSIRKPAKPYRISSLKFFSLIAVVDFTSLSSTSHSQTGKAVQNFKKIERELILALSVKLVN